MGKPLPAPSPLSPGHPDSPRNSRAAHSSMGFRSWWGAQLAGVRRAAGRGGTEGTPISSWPGHLQHQHSGRGGWTVITAGQTSPEAERGSEEKHPFITGPSPPPSEAPSLRHGLPRTLALPLQIHRNFRNWETASPPSPRASWAWAGALEDKGTGGGQLDSAQGLLPSCLSTQVTAWRGTPGPPGGTDSGPTAQRPPSPRLSSSLCPQTHFGLWDRDEDGVSWQRVSHLPSPSPPSLTPFLIRPATRYLPSASLHPGSLSVPPSPPCPVTLAGDGAQLCESRRERQAASRTPGPSSALRAGLPGLSTAHPGAKRLWLWAPVPTQRPGL